MTSTLPLGRVRKDELPSSLFFIFKFDMNKYFIVKSYIEILSQDDKNYENLVSSIAFGARAGNRTRVEASTTPHDNRYTTRAATCRAATAI